MSLIIKRFQKLDGQTGILLKNCDSFTAADLEGNAYDCFTPADSEGDAIPSHNMRECEICSFSYAPDDLKYRRLSSKNSRTVSLPDPLHSWILHKSHFYVTPESGAALPETNKK